MDEKLQAIVNWINAHEAKPHESLAPLKRKIEELRMGIETNRATADRHAAAIDGLVDAVAKLNQRF